MKQVVNITIMKLMSDFLIRNLNILNICKYYWMYVYIACHLYKERS